MTNALQRFRVETTSTFPTRFRTTSSLFAITLAVVVGAAIAEEDDPFAELIKRQPNMAHHVNMVRTSAEAVIGSELTLAALACDATEEERLELRRAAQPELRNLMKEAGMQLNRQFGGGFVDQGNKKTARQVRQEAVEDILTRVYWPKKKAGTPRPAQLVNWEKARASRNAYQDLANARAIVAAINDRLFLDEDQRLAISDSLTEHWDDSWSSYVSVLVHNDHLIPALPDELLKPHLNEEQWQTWKAIPKQGFQNFGWNDLNQAQIFVNAQNRGKQQPRNFWFLEDRSGDDSALPPRDVPTAVQFVVNRLEQSMKKGDAPPVKQDAARVQAILIDEFVDPKVEDAAQEGDSDDD